MACRPVLREKVEILPADDGYRILDRPKHRVHYLNPTAGLVALCCDGTSTSDAIAGQVQRHFGLSTPVAAHVAEIISRLGDEHLLTSCPSPPGQVERYREADTMQPTGMAEEAAPLPAGHRHQAVRQLPARPAAGAYTVPVMTSFSLSGPQSGSAETFELPVSGAGDYAPGKLPTFGLGHPDPQASGNRQRLAFLRRLVEGLK